MASDFTEAIRLKPDWLYVRLRSADAELRRDAFALWVQCSLETESSSGPCRAVVLRLPDESG